MTQDEIPSEIIDALAGGLKLTPEDREFIKDNPGALRKLWDETSQSLLLHHWPEVMDAIATKAKGGDTTAAKFITDHVTATATEGITGSVSIGAMWEEKAIQIRDSLGLEISAETLVYLLITNTPMSVIQDVLLGQQEKPAE